MASPGTDQALLASIGGLLSDAAASARRPDAAAQLAAARHRLHGPLRVAIAGKIKAGKSTLLNALVGEELAPTDAGECTSIVTWYFENDRPAVTIHFPTGHPVDARYTRSDGALAIDLAGHAPPDIDHLEVGWPTSRLRELTLIDTPGIESISTELSERTLDALTPDDGRTSEVDAVVYLLRHTHASDARFLEAFSSTELVHGTPMNALGVLSRADEIGACRLDALEVAHRIADDYQADPRLHRLCPVVLPVAGLLGHAGGSLREAEFSGLRRLAAADADELGELLLTADRLGYRETAIPVDAAERRHLLSRMGLFGVRLSVELLRTGAVRSSTELATELVRLSGLDALREVLLRQFADRSAVLKARSALQTVRAVLGADGCSDANRLAARLEEITAGAHAFQEVRLLDRLRNGELRFRPEQATELDRILGGTGHDPSRRLGLPPDADASTVRDVTIDLLQRWQSIAEHPLSGRAEQVAARGACRTLEGILASGVAADSAALGTAARGAGH